MNNSGLGYKKGSFTGADTDKEGLLQEADGGYLFLDEVHRLSYENQEKLFVFMDTGRRIFKDIYLLPRFFYSL